MDIQVEGKGMKVTAAMQKYIENKFQKLERFEKLITSIKVLCKQEIYSRGIEKDFRVEVTINVPKAIVRVEKYGSDLYAIIDESIDVVMRKMERYKSTLRKWKAGKGSDVEVEVVMENEEGFIDYYVYKPEISKKKGIDDCQPIRPEEAVERMMLLGHDFFLFRNLNNSKWSVVYKRKDGTFGLIEPKCE